MEVKTIDDVKVAVIVPRLDGHAAGEMETALNDLIQQGTGKLLFDFSRTGYISSAGLRLLIVTGKKLQKNGGKLVLCSIQPYVREVMDLVGLIPYFTIYDSEEEALKSFE